MSDQLPLWLRSLDRAAPFIEIALVVLLACFIVAGSVETVRLLPFSDPTPYHYSAFALALTASVFEVDLR
ncbi:hypothetical protein [Salinarchaeum laminariae]|uniref:hypothetical protein n=1 Tax=Salinarchaeum laminariae TaxID=869888 RepID=UPI0020BF1E31|nr:hypothetical protein [Salinarchaeum laminariae]